jgi:hypothetical protein
MARPARFLPVLLLMLVATSTALVVLLLSDRALWAQVGGPPVGPTDACRDANPNVSGVAGADITVDTTAVTVIATNTRLCQAIIFNTSTTQPLRCRSLNHSVPTGVSGFPLLPGSALALGLEAQKGWSCVRDTSATGSATVATFELTP